MSASSSLLREREPDPWQSAFDPLTLGAGVSLLLVLMLRGAWEWRFVHRFLGDHGWYFQVVGVPDELAGKEHLYLYFRGVNEQAWVYVNGELAFERSYASTGKSVGELAGVPFSFDAKAWLKPGAGNRVAVRVTHASGLGGITMPAMLVGTDDECSTEQLTAYRY